MESELRQRRTRENEPHQEEDLDVANGAPHEHTGQYNGHVHQDDGYDKLWKPAYKPPTFQDLSDNRLISIVGVLTFVSFVLHFYDISRSNRVVWDEAHFGKFASYYLRRSFYFDVHPPLGKMLLGFSGALAGYNGSFSFESGEVYPPELHYGIMRLFCAMFGALTVPVAFLTSHELGFSPLASVFAATMTLCDIALLVISRFILLDSMLLFFTTTSLYCLTKFHNWQKEEPFCLEWWFWMAMTGLNLGCVASVKWVGLFAIALVGFVCFLYTIQQLWSLLSSPEPILSPPYTYLKHWGARIICLIALPIMVYLISFVMHFFILNRSGSGDAQMNSLFQANLHGTDLLDSPLEVAFGSKVTIKSNRQAGGLLHSHVQRYPSGSEQQQITTYHHKDGNNNWIIHKPHGQEQPNFNTSDIEFLKDGDVIRLVHEQTGRNLHSHPIAAPVTTADYEVSCYGNSSIGDMNDLWKIEIIDDVLNGKGQERIHALSTRFRLRHVVTGCLLRSTLEQLPQWGYKQGEVTCERNNLTSDATTWWNVEKHWNERLPNMPRQKIKTLFFKDFIEHNIGMWQSNNALTPDPDKEPEALISYFWQWPWGTVGMRMCGWERDQWKFYLVGNPIVWWGGTASVIVFGLVVIGYLVKRRRTAGGKTTWTDDAWSHFLYVGLTLLGGWFLHYFPFALMGRVTYLHHYFPALYFSIILFAFVTDHLTYHYTHRVLRWLIFAVLFAAVVGTFYYFSPFVFGFKGSARDMAGRRWLNSWNIHD